MGVYCRVSLSPLALVHKGCRTVLGVGEEQSHVTMSPVVGGGVTSNTLEIRGTNFF